MGKKINMIIVENNTAFLEGISSFIERDSKFNIIAKFFSGIELLKFPNLCLADLILLDIEMPELNGIETAKRVNFKCPNIKLVAITMYQDKIYLRQLIEAGFNGFVNKVTVPEGLFNTIEATLQNRFLFPENINL